MSGTAKRFARLHQLEVLCYFAVYILYLVYGLWKLYGLRDTIVNIAKYQFSPGWNWIGRQRDDTNDELLYFNEYITDMWPWYVLHLLVSALLSVFSPQHLSVGHALVSIVALLCTQHQICLLLLAGLLFSYYLAAHTASKSFTWCVSALWMLLIILIKTHTDWGQALDYKVYYTLIVSVSWSLLRGCSFALTCISDRSASLWSLHSVQRFLGYTLYLPTFVYGPLISYRRYTAMYDTDLSLNRKQRVAMLKNRFSQLCWELARVLCWWFVLHVLQHFLYLDYMSRDVFAVSLVQPPFSHYAIGYFMGQFFFLYYVFTYGLGIAFAHFDAMRPPRRPRCIGRIHFYSDMWKYFDEGLYEFLFQHIYAELCHKNSGVAVKLCATAVTFSFVFLWHGCYVYVLIWSALNFGCLVVEKCFKTLLSSRSYMQWAHKYLGVVGAQRLYALLGTQIFIPAAFANVYFIGGREVGDFLMRSAYLSGWANYMALTFCSYCFFQCSELILGLRKMPIN